MGPRHLKYFASFEIDMNKMNTPIQAIRKQRFLSAGARRVLRIQHTHSGERQVEKLEKPVLCVHPNTDMNMLGPFTRYVHYVCHRTASGDVCVVL